MPDICRQPVVVVVIIVRHVLQPTQTNTARPGSNSIVRRSLSLTISGWRFMSLLGWGKGHNRRYGEDITVNCDGWSIINYSIDADLAVEKHWWCWWLYINQQSSTDYLRRNHFVNSTQQNSTGQLSWVELSLSLWTRIYKAHRLRQCLNCRGG